jgi:multidrug efflux pump subunit AcrB
MLADRSQSPGLISTFVRHPNAANLLMALLVLFGLFSIARINTQFFPTVERPNISVGVSWRGASAEDVESNILAIVEPAVRFIDGVEQITSYAREGSGRVVLEFAEGSDMETAASDVETAVKTITNLPEDADAPTVSRSRFFDGVASISISGDVPESHLRMWAKRLRDDLLDRGIDKIEFTGLRDEEIHIKVPEAQLRRFGLTIGDLSTLIARNSSDLPSGSVGGELDRQLRTVTELRSPAALRALEIKAFPNGNKVLLGDIATITSGFESGATQGFARSGARAIELDVRRAPTADTLQTAAILADYIEEIRPQLPANLNLQVYEVSADSLSARIGLLVKNGLSGLVLVVAILFLFLHARIAFWVAAGIPVAMLATIGLMFVSGQTINMMSLFALIMMLGVIVDDAIVVGEHTDTRLSLGDDPVSAAENGVGMMVGPVLSAMGTTIASFSPILLIGGVIGQIMGVLPLVVIAVIVASLIECFFILPGHLAHAIDEPDNAPARRWSHWRHLLVSVLFASAIIIAIERFGSASLPPAARFAIDILLDWRSTFPPVLFFFLIAAIAYAIAAVFELLFGLLAGAYGTQSSQLTSNGRHGFRYWFDRGFNWFRDGPINALVGLAFRWRYVTVAISVSLALVIVGGLMRGGHVGFVFFPSPESENIRGNIIFHAGTSEDAVIAGMKKFEAAVAEAERELSPDGTPLIRAVFTTIGQSGRNEGDNLVQMKVQLTSSEERTVRTPEIIRVWQRLAPDLPDVRRFSISQQRGGPPGKDVDILLQGARASTLKAAALEVAAELEQIAGVSGVSDDLPYGKPEIIVKPNARGAALGFTVDEIGRQLRNAYDGATPFRFAQGDQEVTVRLSQTASLEGTGGLRNLNLRSPSGAFVPLAEIVDVTETQGFAAIQRRNGKTTLSVSGDIDSDINTTDGVIEELRDRGTLDLIAAKHGVRYDFSGRAEEQREAFADLGIGTAVALSVIYIILAWQFGSYFMPFAIMLIIPFGIVGAVFGHWVLDFQLTILSMIGLLGLSGILVNDSIILVARLQERLRDGDDLETAAIGASRDRLRAVLLTSLTTIGGLLPLMYEKSLQAQFLLPMAVTIIFGLAMSTLLVLFLVPAFVGVGRDIRASLGFLFGQEKPLRQVKA